MSCDCVRPRPAYLQADTTIAQQLSALLLGFSNRTMGGRFNCFGKVSAKVVGLKLNCYNSSHLEAKFYFNLNRMCILLCCEVVDGLMRCGMLMLENLNCHLQIQLVVLKF